MSVWPMGRHLAIDVGSATTRVWVRGRGLVVSEPTVVAVDPRRDRVLAAGRPAVDVIDRTPDGVVLENPVRDGVVRDYAHVVGLLRLLLGQAGLRRWHRAVVLVCVPHATAQAERRALDAALREAGAGPVRMLSAPVAAAVGAGLPVDRPRGSMVLDVGAGRCEVVVASYGGAVVCRSLPVGGTHLNAALRRRLRCIHGLVIGEGEAERLKTALGAALPMVEARTVDVTGRAAGTGLPVTVAVGAEEVRQALDASVAEIVHAVGETLGDCPAELAHDVGEDGIWLAGGSARLPGLDARIAAEVGVPAHLVDQPETCTIRGAGAVLEQPPHLRQLLLGDGDGSWLPNRT